MYRTQNDRPDFTRELSVDAVIVGGGVSGVAAALAAGRAGVRTALIQDRPMLGGVSSPECSPGNAVMITGASNYHNRNAREAGIMEELKNTNLYRQHCGCGCVWSQVLLSALEACPCVTVLLNTSVNGVETSGTRITAVKAYGLTSGLHWTIRGKYFVDASGDGFVGFAAGAAYRMGREGRDEFGESLAPETPDQLTMGSSIAFRASDTGRPVKFVPPAKYHVFASDDDLPYRPHGATTAGYYWLEYGGTLDTIADDAEIYAKLREIVYGVWDHIKNRGDHHAENYRLDWISPVAGKRESRRFEGDYMLSQRDLEAAGRFDDEVAYGGWPVDLHPPQGIFHPGHPGSPPPRFYPDVYPIPFRALYSRNIENLLFAGRDISASHVALGSARVMGTCGIEGQAVGTALALLVKYGVTPRELVRNHMRELRQMLDAEDLTIPGRSPDLPGNRAPEAEVTAESDLALVMQEASGSEPLKRPADASVTIEESLADPRLGQSFRWEGGKLDAVRIRFRNTGEKAAVVTAHLTTGFGAPDLAVLSADVPPGDGAVGVFAFARDLAPGNYVLILDPCDQVDVLTSARYLPAFHRQSAFAAKRYRMFVFDLLPEQRPFTAADLRTSPGRPDARPNLWISEEKLPASVRWTWKAPVELDTVELLFDTNLDQPQIGVPAKETVKSYRLSAVAPDGTEETLADEPENFLRFRRHTFTKRSVASLKLEIRSTWGDPSARLFALRCFAKGVEK